VFAAHSRKIGIAPLLLAVQRLHHDTAVKDTPPASESLAICLIDDYRHFAVYEAAILPEIVNRAFRHLMLQNLVFHL